MVTSDAGGGSALRPALAWSATGAIIGAAVQVVSLLTSLGSLSAPLLTTLFILVVAGAILGGAALAAMARRREWRVLRGVSVWRHVQPWIAGIGAAGAIALLLLTRLSTGESSGQAFGGQFPVGARSGPLFAALASIAAFGLVGGTTAAALIERESGRFSWLSSVASGGIWAVAWLVGAGALLIGSVYVGHLLGEVTKPAEAAGLLLGSMLGGGIGTLLAGLIGEAFLLPALSRATRRATRS